MIRYCLSILSRLGRVVLSLVLLVVSLSACTSWESEPGEPITLTFACQRSELTVYQAAAETFHQANPSIEIHLIPLDEIVSFPLEDETDTLGPVRQLAAHADAFIWTTDAVEGGPPGLVLDLSSFIEADGEPAEADFLPGLVAHFRWQGGTWGLPAGVEPLVVLYDQVAFEAAGLVPPAPGWTWDDLFDAAQQLTQREGEQVVRYGFADFELDGLRSFVEARGGQLVDDTDQPPLPTLDDPRTVAAVQQYTDLALDQGVMPNPTEQTFGDSFGIVQQDKAAMSVTLSRFWVDGERNDGLGVAPLPGGSPAWLYGYFVSAGTVHPEAAWRWLRFLSREVTPPDLLPARQNLIARSAYATAAGEEALQVFRYAAEHALLPLHPAAVDVLLRQAAEQVFEGQEAKSALAEAQEQALSPTTPEAAEPLPVPSPAPAQDTEETITFVAFDDRPYKPLVETFQDIHPHTEVVVLQAMDFDYYGDQPAEMLNASGADCFVDTTDILALAPPIRNLQPFVDADSSFPLDDYLPWALEQIRRDGDLWGLPADVIVNVMWYNRALFEETGVPYPDPTGDWSWDDVFLIAHMLSGGEQSNRRYGYVIWPDRTVFLLEEIGGPFVDVNAVPPAFRFDAPEIVVAAQQLADMVQSQVSPTPAEPDQRDTSHSELFELIMANRVGMWEGTKGWRSSWEQEGFDFRPVPLPKRSRCLFAAATAYFITADTPRAETCWEWIRFLSEHLPPDGCLPPRHSLLTSNAFRAQVGADDQAIYLRALECEEWGWLRGMASLPPYSNYTHTWLEQALDEILWHGADAQATLSETQQKAETYLDCLRQRPDLDDETSAEACFQEVDTP